MSGRCEPTGPIRSIVTVMKKSNEKIIGDAKRTARRLARTRTETYQSCLDLVAREAGRVNWSAFLADPVDLRVPDLPERVMEESGMSATGSRFIVNDPLRDVDGEIAKRHGGSPAASEVRTPRPRPGHGEGVILGVLNMINGESRTLRSARSSIVLCVGEPATGKTMGVLLPTIAGSPDASMLIHDPKPEVLSAIVALGLRTESRVVVLDALDASKGPMERIAFNPLHPSFRLPDEGWSAHARRVATIMMPSEKRGLSYFVERGRDVLAGIISYLMRLPDEVPSDGRNGRRIASLPAVDEWLALAYSQGISETFGRAAARTLSDGDMREAHVAFSTMERMGHNDLVGIVGTVARSLLQVRNVQVRAYLDPAEARDGASLVDALTDPGRTTTAIIMNDLRHAESVSVLTALAIDMVGRWRSAQGPSARSLQILIDEANKIMHVPWIGEIMRDGPAPGTTVLLISQNPERLRLSPEDDNEETVALRVQHVVDMRHASPEGDRMLRNLVGRDVVALDPERRHGRQRLVDADGFCELTTPYLFPPRRR
jgi:hypothetical protein